jgi:hypothetical protein
MIAVIALLLFLYGVVLVIELGALIEMFEQIKQVRIFLDMVDRPLSLDLDSSLGLEASTVGLPSALNDAERAMVLFLSNKCTTCRKLAATIAGGSLPLAMWVVIVPVMGDAEDFVDEFQLRGDRILVDEGQRIASQMRLSTTPAAVFVENGRLARAQTVPSVRELYSALPVPSKNRTATPEFGRNVAFSLAANIRHE